MKLYSTGDSSNNGMGQQESEQRYFQQIDVGRWCEWCPTSGCEMVQAHTNEFLNICWNYLPLSILECKICLFWTCKNHIQHVKHPPISPFFFLEALILDTLQQRSIGVRNAGDSMRFIEFRASREITATGCQEKLCENRFRNFNFGEMLHTELYVRRCWTTSKKPGHFQGCEALRGSFLLHAACSYMWQFKVFKI